ncbi:hypothetical protein EZV73_21320 [Acidaminobacter sp. JC074]|uniref:hypothetical protein n=1 Tax=Acidaminobacter sp. JC074 TaxID=2530199 RepID=UPI001F0F245A|nr:hypothetical protein [Acidaminobacter sp. JC074]MCH4890135.1 hypothetical protein [Acidaminobacter sp. JC074]
MKDIILNGPSEYYALLEKNITFGFKAELDETVSSKKLRQALNDTLDIYKGFKVKLVGGILKFRFKVNENELPIYHKRVDKVESFDIKDNNDYLFRVLYFENQILLEFSHALCDGSGGLEFMKKLLYTYQDQPYQSITLSKTIEDAYSTYREKVIPKKELSMNESRSFDFTSTGDFYHLSYKLDTKKVIMKSKLNSCSVSVLLTSVFIHTLYVLELVENENINLSVPVDFRNVFPSKTLYNFAGSYEFKVNYDKDLRSLDECYKKIGDLYKSADPNKPFLVSDTLARWPLNFIPIFLKKKILLNKGGIYKKNINFSNLGRVEPIAGVKNLSFLLPQVASSPVSVAVLSYGKSLNMDITTNYKKSYYECLEGILKDLE